IRGLTFERLPQLKAYWRLSMKALITRAARLGAIDAAASTRLYKQYSARRYNVQEPYSLPPEPPSLIDAAIRVHYEDHDYSPAELAAAMRLNPDEFLENFSDQQAFGGGKVVSIQELRERHRA